jgi:hypothetical protein
MMAQFGMKPASTILRRLRNRLKCIRMRTAPVRAVAIVTKPVGGTAKWHLQSRL